MNNEAFIDGQNLRFSTTKADKAWDVDLKRFRTYLDRKYNVARAYYFMGYQMQQHAELYRKIQEAGYILIFRQHNEKMDSVKKGNVDTDIVFTIMQKIADREKFDKVILVSGDGDYYKMVQYLIEKNKFARLLAPNEKRMSSLYKIFEPKYYAFLNRLEVQDKIALKKRNKKAGSA
ncbi:MAG: NYN domain-containing protein [Candidatus Nomurabacteria bacterium]|nr:NYN domain-containing protein [Candidatus Nomurabacteria bacterium]